MNGLSRRWILVGGALTACSRSRSESTPTPSAPATAPPSATVAVTPAIPAPAPDASASTTATPVLSTIEWDLGARGRAVVLVSAPPGARVPLVIALHGRGESLKGPRRGGYGWPQDYALARALERVVAPPLTAADFEGLIEPERLRRINDRLATTPFRGLAVACPFLPDFDWSKPPSATIDAYGRFLLDEIVSRAQRELPVIASAGATGIDGVSLGGCMALRAGFRFADRFGAVGSLQGALNPTQVEELALQAKAARHANPALALRLATSKDDAFVNSNHALARALSAAGIEHLFENYLGPHDYIWNRGPGSYELLLFHDSALSHKS